jgi:signal transduction histidine kinase
VPLVVEGQVTGVLHVGTLESHAFSDADIELLQIAADRAAIAIEHARLFEAEHAARLQLEAVQLVTDVALQHLELDELLRELLVRIRDVLRADTAAFLALEPGATELVARAAVGLEEEVEAGVRVPVGRGFAGRVAASQQPVIIRDLATFDVVNPILRQKGIKSMLGVPLLSSGETIGVLHVGTLAPREFTPDDVKLLELVAERAAVAIERARVHQEIVRLDQMKLNFVAVASHELRTPASALYGAAMTLRERGSELPPEYVAQLQEMLWVQSDRLRRLIEQLLDLSRLDARSIAIEPRRVDVLRAVQDVIATAGAGDVHVDVDPGLEAEVDPLAFERVLTNLVVNALRYGAPPVVITAAQTDRHLRVAVEDNGPGISDELAPRLFERFERGLDAEGSGLGLAIAKAYAVAHGGDVLYDPRGRGARFVLAIPNTPNDKN